MCGSDQKIQYPKVGLKRVSGSKWGYGN